MKIKIEIDTDGSAFGDDEFSAQSEVYRIIQKDVLPLVGDGLHGTRMDDHILKDLNGNRCGFIKVTK